MGCKSEPPICKSKLFFLFFDLQIADCDLHLFAVICRVQISCKSAPPICKSKLFCRAFDLQIVGREFHVICNDLQGANQLQIMRIPANPNES